MKPLAIDLFCGLGGWSEGLLGSEPRRVSPRLVPDHIAWRCNMAEKYSRTTRHGTGTMLGKRGYILRSAKEHPRAGRDGYVPEHVLIVEAAIGHYLDPRHVVHHVDRNPANNSRSNLVACEDQGYHLLLHRRLRAFEACGDASALKCGICGGYDRQPDIATYRSIRPGRPIGFQYMHRDCNSARVRAYAERKRAA